MSRARAAYARLYRRLPVPRSVAAVPQLPGEPLSRRFGLDRGRPVDRVFIERFLQEHAADIRGRVLEVYEDTYSRRFGTPDRVDVVDANPTAAATLVGDLREPGWLPGRAFDCIVLTQTLHSAPDPGAVLRSLAAALAPGGVLLATFAGISQRSRAGEDDAFLELWRFTSDGVRRLFDGTGLDADVRAHGNLLAAASFLYGMSEEETDPAAFASDDPDYEVVVCARATLKA
jgi:SAM-dependent methyltransferase